MKRKVVLFLIFFLSFSFLLRMPAHLAEGSNDLVIPFLTVVPNVDGSLNDWNNEGLNDTYYTSLLFDYSSHSLQGSFRMGIADGQLFFVFIIADPTPIGYENKTTESDFCDTLYLYLDTDNSSSWTEGADDVKVVELSRTNNVHIIDGYFHANNFANTDPHTDFHASAVYSNQRWYVELSLNLNSSDMGDLKLNGGENVVLTVDYRDAVDPTIAEIDNGFDSNIGEGIYETGEYIGFLDKPFLAPQADVQITLVRNYSPTSISSGDEINITYILGSNTPVPLKNIILNETFPEELKNIRVYGIDYLLLNATNNTVISMKLSRLDPGEFVTFSINTTVITNEETEIVLEKMNVQYLDPYGNKVNITIGSKLTITISTESETTNKPSSSGGTATKTGWYWYILGAAGIVMIGLGILFYFGRPKS